STARVLIIDEINRGNVSRIFGELITLIEQSKRAGAEEALSVVLPYSKQRFSVPQNVYLIGTMNTADRSLAGLDIALRRRFEFREMPPRPELLDDVRIGGLNVGQLLRTMNQRIE
ncbi:AAA family ATPase, partial [Pseudomonas aeruginosa]|nr:AAA family ATPase [Pseudomonas aeruginosa]